ncbi:MAG: hypothetical protein GXP55_20830 [Deltaproteobacteria bacterium]|nr:hypothetical protein [Deltaproteobacteria bacterium]
MLPTLAAATLLGVVAPVLRALMMGVPLGLLSIGMALRSFVSAAMTVVVFGALARVCSIFILPLTPPELGLWAAGVGLALATPLVLLSSARRRRMRGALLLAYRLKDEMVREQSLSALTRLVRRSRPRSGRPSTSHVQLLLMLAAPLTAFGLSEQLEVWLSDAPAHGLDPRTAALRAQTLATCRVESGDVEGAAEALDAVPESGVDPVLSAWLTATRALLLAVGEQPEAALEKLGPDVEDQDAALLASRCIVRAHVLAARADEAGAERELCAALESVGASALGRASRPEGPASALAERLARELEELEDEDEDELGDDELGDEDEDELEE